MSVAKNTYRTFDRFKIEFQKAWPDVRKDKRVASDVEAIRAFSYYCAGLRLGGADSAGISIGLIEMLKKTEAWTKNEMGASVLRNPESGTLFITDKANESLWEIWHNDAFILGGIHSLSRKGFTLVSVNEWEKNTKPPADLCNKAVAGFNQLDFADFTKEFPLRVTQREIIGIQKFGYSKIETGANVVYKLNPKEQQSAENATLFDYRKYADNFGR